MIEYLQFVIFGLTTGSVYAISAMGLVLTYKISGLFNFGHGAVCAAGAFVFYSAHQQADLPWPTAALLAIGIFGVVAGLLLERVALVLSAVHISYKIVGTVGILVGIRALAGLIYGENARAFDPFISQKEVFSINGVIVGYDHLLNLLLAVGAAIALYLFFRTTRLGTAMRGVVDDPQLLDMSGTSPAGVRRSGWIIGNVFASTSGVLFAAAQQQLDVNVLSLLVVQAFGAAAIARFSSLPMCLVGGLAVGVLQKLMSKEVADHPALQGLDLNMPFIVLFIALLAIPRHQLVEVGRQVKARAVPPSQFSGRTRAGGYAFVLGVALLVPAFAGSRLPVWNTAMTQVVLFASLALLVKTSGQISLCHVGFAAIGATGFGHMLSNGVPWGLAVLLGGLWAVPAGALIAIPAIRLSGLYLGLATLGFGVLLAQYAYTRPWMFGDGQLDVHRPSRVDSNEAYYYLLLGIALVSLGLVGLVERSRLGRLLRSMADSPLALSTLGTSVNISRVLVFCLSTFLAGISGATYASLFSSVNQESFNYVQSLIVLAVLAAAGRRTITIAIVAPVLLYVIPGYLDNPKAILVLQVGFGVAAIFAAAMSQGALGHLAARESTAHADRVRDPVFGRSSRAREVAAPPPWRLAPQRETTVHRKRDRVRV
jgi:ABC-type branched-subunit amino acid transport system permease subunit